MSLAGILFSNRNDTSLFRLTEERTAGAIPFGGRYRLVDFPLTDLAIAGARRVTLVSNGNFDTLLEHVGTGEAWGLSPHGGGVNTVTPFRYPGSTMFHGRMDALFCMRAGLERMQEPYIVLGDCHTVFRIDLCAVLRAHQASGAAMTLVCAPTQETGDVRGGVFVAAGEGGRVCDVTVAHAFPGALRWTGMAMLSRVQLLSFLSAAHGLGETSFVRGVLLRQSRQQICQVYRLAGPVAYITDEGSYYAASLRLLQDRTVYRTWVGTGAKALRTTAPEEAPCLYGEGAAVRASLIASGCRIEGEVEKSILFPGVRVAPGASVKGCILLPGVTVGRCASLYAVCADAQACIRPGSRLAGHPTLPLFLPKEKVV